VIFGTSMGVPTARRTARSQMFAGGIGGAGTGTGVAGAGTGPRASISLETERERCRRTSNVEVSLTSKCGQVTQDQQHLQMLQQHHHGSVAMDHRRSSVSLHAAGGDDNNPHYSSTHADHADRDSPIHGNGAVKYIALRRNSHHGLQYDGQFPQPRSSFLVTSSRLPPGSMHGGQQGHGGPHEMLTGTGGLFSPNKSRRNSNSQPSSAQSSRPASPGPNPSQGYHLNHNQSPNQTIKPSPSRTPSPKSGRSAGHRPFGPAILRGGSPAAVHVQNIADTATAAASLVDAHLQSSSPHLLPVEDASVSLSPNHSFLYVTTTASSLLSQYGGGRRSRDPLDSATGAAGAGIAAAHAALEVWVEEEAGMSSSYCNCCRQQSVSDKIEVRLYHN
jgi:hypothetical protein